MRVVPAVLLLALAACRDEPSFDERFDKAQQEVSKTAAEIDAELKKRRDEAARGAKPVKAAEPGQ